MQADRRAGGHRERALKVNFTAVDEARDAIRPASTESRFHSHCQRLLKATFTIPARPRILTHMRGSKDTVGIRETRFCMESAYTP